MTEETNTPTGITRRTVVAGAAWSVPVFAAAVAIPLAAASTPAPTDIGVTLQPTPAQVGVPTRLTYFGTADFDQVPFPAGSTATVVVTGTFSGVTWSGATVSSDSGAGTDPRTITLTITNLASFYVQGTADFSASIFTTVYDGNSVEIGNSLITFADPV